MPDEDSAPAESFLFGNRRGLLASRTPEQRSGWHVALDQLSARRTPRLGHAVIRLLDLDQRTRPVDDRTATVDMAYTTVYTYNIESIIGVIR